MMLIEPAADDIYVAMGIVALGSLFNVEPITMMSLLCIAANKAEFCFSSSNLSDKVLMSLPLHGEADFSPSLVSTIIFWQTPSSLVTSLEL